MSETFKVNNLSVKKKYNLGNFEMLELSIDASPEDNNINDWENVSKSCLKKMINLLDETRKEK